MSTQVSTSPESLGYVSQGHSGWDTENMAEKRAVAEILRARAHSMKSCMFVPGFLSGFLDKFLPLNLLMFNENSIDYYHLLKKKERKAYLNIFHGNNVSFVD